MERNLKIHLLLLAVVCFFTFFIHNEAVIPDIMESRNLVTAREMVEYDNWLVPTMNGDLRLEKPPLPTWIAGVIEKVSPDNVTLQRAAAGLMATLLVFFMYFLGLRLSRRALYGLVTALVLCTSFNIILMGRTASWDIYCHSFMLGAIYFFYRAFELPGKQWRNFVLSGIFMGLSFLGKGPVSFYALLLPFLLTYFPIYRPSLKRKWWPLTVMIVLCLLISLWWPLYLYFFHYDMAMMVAAKESSAWLERNVRPWYYYWKFFLESGIWSLFLVTALIWPYWSRRVKLCKVYLLSVSWMFAILILLSFLPEKKTRYLLPILIPAALTVAQLFFYWAGKLRRNGLAGWDKIFFRVNTLLIAVIVVLLPVGVYLFFYAKGEISTGWFLFSSGLFLLAAWLLFSAAIRLYPLRFLGGVVFLFFVVEAFLMPLVAAWFNNPDIKSLRAVRTIERLEGLPFYYPDGEELRIELVYEAGRRIKPLNLCQDTLLLNNLPFALVSASKAEELLSSALLEKVELEYIGTFDDNHRKKNTRFYSGKFIRNVTIIRKKSSSLSAD